MGGEKQIQMHRFIWRSNFDMSRSPVRVPRPRTEPGGYICASSDQKIKVSAVYLLFCDQNQDHSARWRSCWKGKRLYVRIARLVSAPGKIAQGLWERWSWQEEEKMRCCQHG